MQLARDKIRKVCLATSFDSCAFYNHGAVFEVALLGLQTNSVNNAWKKIPAGVARFNGKKGSKNGQYECNSADLVPLALHLRLDLVQQNIDQWENQPHKIMTVPGVGTDRQCPEPREVLPMRLP